MRRTILDHGYIELVEAWGSDEGIVEAARMSTGKGFQGWGTVEDCANCHGSAREPGFGFNHNCRTCGGDFSPHGPCKTINTPGDEKLLKYLWARKHTSPFEMAGAIIEVKAPIFVFREWHRHRTQSYSEVSARYTPLPNESYLPDYNDAVARSETAARNKQAGRADDAPALTIEKALELLDEEARLLVAVENLYQRKLKAGFTKELARTHLTVSRYSRMRAQAVLLNWLKFLMLREDSGAQWEIRQYANALHEILAERFPRTMAVFEGVKT